MKRRSATYHAPRECPVCGDELVVTRLGCPGCGSELAGTFENCQFCSLDEGELEILRVFLASRGNLREVEKHLGVSYPTARLRFTELLLKLGLAGETDPPARLSQEQVLAEVTAGALTPAEAATLLAEL
jgi:hypothetical protein